MCQSQTVVLPSPLPLFLHMRRRVTREEGSAYLIRKVLERGTPTIPLNYKLARNGFSAVVACRLENLSFAPVSILID